MSLDQTLVCTFKITNCSIEDRTPHPIFWKWWDKQYTKQFLFDHEALQMHILWIIKINCPVIYIIEFYLTHYFNVEILLNMNISLIKWLEVKATYFFITTLLKLRHRASHTNNCCLEIKITEMATIVIMVDSRPSYLSTIIKTCQSLHWHFSCSK